MKLKISVLTAAVIAILAAAILALCGCDDGAVSPDQSNQTNQTTLRSNGSELMPSSRICLAHSLAVNRLWSR